METRVKYKKPRRINAVSVTLVLLLVAGGYTIYQYLPLFMLRHEAYRVLQETGSTLAGRSHHYSRNADELEQLRLDMQRDLEGLGIVDPEIETWIELDGKDVRLGVVYSAWTEWPLGIIPRQRRDYEVEHRFVLN